jgi:FKBP-type peptidyl-prolyl cis-trans isomerase
MSHSLRPRRLLSVFPVLALAMAACGDPDPPPVEEPRPAAEVVDLHDETFAPELGIDLDAMERTDSGVYYRVDEEGEGGRAERDRTVEVHYTGRLADGTTFDSSRDADQPFAVRLGVGQVIPGFEDGIIGMEVGERRTVVIPPHLAYGPEGAAPVIPPNAVLIFEIQLLSVSSA